MPNFRGATVGTTTERGYGISHVQARKQAFDALPEWSTCVRCGRPLWKYAKAEPDTLGRIRSAIHYDHAENGTYLGFSHKVCNLHAGAVKGGIVATSKQLGTCAMCGQVIRKYHPNQTRCANCRRLPPTTTHRHPDLTSHYRVTGLTRPDTYGKRPDECQVDDCDRPVRARGWCNMHYIRWYVTGDPTQPAGKSRL